NYAGIVGIGSNNSTSTFNNIVVQVPSPATTFTYTENFTNGSAQYFAQTSGWAGTTGAYTGTAPAGGVAIDLMDLGTAVVPNMAPSTFSLAPTSLLDLKATFSTTATGRGGLIYDYYNAGYYKFAALLADTQQVVLGHYTTKGGFVFDEVKSYTVTAGAQYTLE